MKESLIGIMTQPQAVIVTIASDYVDRIDEVAVDLAANGLKVRDVMKSVGAINGDIVQGTSWAKLEKVAGVQKITRSMMAKRHTEWSPRG